LTLGQACKHKYFRILFLDKRNQIIADEVQQKGTVDHTPGSARSICRQRRSCWCTITPQGTIPPPTPSRADIEMTKQAKPLGVLVHDHVGKKGHASFRGLGLI